MRFDKFSFIIIILIGINTQSFSQNFDWLRTLKNSDKAIWNHGWTIHNTVSLQKGGSAILFVAANDVNSIDTLFLDTFKILTAKDKRQIYYLAIIDSLGKVLQLNALGQGCSKAKASTGDIFSINGLCVDNQGNFYTIVYLSDSLNIIGTDTFNILKGCTVLCKFDKNFKLIWANQTGKNKSLGLSYESDPIQERLPKTDLFYSDEKLYFIIASKDTAMIGNKKYGFGTSLTSVFGELNVSTGNILWSNFLYTNKGTDNLRITGLTKLKSNLFLCGDISIPKQIIVINKDSFWTPGGFIVETDSIGNYIKRFVIHNKYFLSIECIASNGKNLFFGGNFRDSLMWGTKQIRPSYSRSLYNKLNYYGLDQYGMEIFVASIASDLNVRWFYKPTMLDTNNYQYSNMIRHVKFNNGFLYYGGQFYTKILIENNIITPKSLLWKFGSFLLFKMDDLGNIIWTTSGDGAIQSIDAVANKSVFIAGLFNKKIQLGKFRDSTNNNGFGRFLTKITDYSITRGKVSNGPYCAGDTIKIPYTKFGDFDTANVFIAELSNEQGNFDGGGRELGRLKSNKDGVVKGTLPLFQVSTSTQYRIRIRSTSPKIQSYYVTDTLRLLIYSKDKANPGPTETICMGDSLKLNTYGGTKWTWSPKYRMDDSTKRQPTVWPIKNTTYKIIIGDSSGCGAPDTAFKKVIVRPALKTILAFSDTTVCGDGALRVPYYFTGGDSVNYRFQWYFVSNPKLWFTMKGGQNLLRDTLTYTPSDPLEKLAIILKDGCTNKADTAYLIISQRKPVVIKPSYRDTTPCTGNLLKYKATATGGVPKQYRYQWKDLVSNSILSTTDSLKILTKKALKIQLIVNDGCEALGDTASFEVKVKAELKVITNLRDTTICERKTLNYTAQATRGNGSGYNYLWIVDNKLVSTSNALTLNTLYSVLATQILLITKDHCSANDTVKKTITVNPSPKADFSWDLACSRTVTKFTFAGTKPNSPITTIFHWNFNNESPSYLENPSYLFTIPGTKKISLATTSSNGCTDTIKKDVVIKPQSKADFTANDVCETDSAVFINKSQDATGYLWKFGDGQNSKLQNPKHKYQISSTTTYNVTLVAQVTNGCADSISKAVTINKNPSSDFSYTYNGTKVDLKITKAGNAYQWKFGTTDSAKTTATTYSHTIKSSDQTKVCLTATDNISGCSSQTCKNVSVGILKVSEKNFKIYPNPNNGSFTIEIENPSKDASIEIFNLLGKLVKKVETNSSKSVYEIDLNSADGMYWVRVKNGDEIWNQKVSIFKSN